jgi:hypothetical protein
MLTAIREYIDSELSPLLLQGLTEMCKRKPENPKVPTHTDIVLIFHSCGWLSG